MVRFTLPIASIALFATLGCSAPSLEGSLGETEASQVACPAAVSSFDVAVHNDIGEIHGTLEVPAGCGPFPAVLMLPGSGAGDRDGNSPNGRPNMYRLLASELAARGVASIRYDKAGVGASAGALPREIDVRFEMGAEDAALFIPVLRKDPRIERVVLVGHSEGAHLAMLAAHVHEIDGYVALAGAGRPIGTVLREQLARQGMDDATWSRVEDVLDRLERGATVDPLPDFTASPGLRVLFRPSIQPYLISWMKRDPAEDLRNVDVPTLIVQGTTDVQVSVADARRLAEAKPEARLSLVEGMNHVLKEATLDPASQARAYGDPSLPVVPELVERLVSFTEEISR